MMKKRKTLMSHGKSIKDHSLKKKKCLIPAGYLQDSKWQIKQNIISAFVSVSVQIFIKSNVLIRQIGLIASFVLSLRLETRIMM